MAQPHAVRRLPRAVAAVPPQGLLLVSMVSVQVGAAVAVNLFPVIGPVATTLLRLALSAVLLLALSGRTVDSSARRHAGSVVLYGLILAAMNLTFYGAISRIPLGIAVAIEFVGLLGLAVITSRRLLDFVWIALAGLGILLLTPEIGGALDPVGVALAGAAGVCWASFAVLSKRISRLLPGNSGLALATLVAAIAVLPVELAIGGAGLSRLDLGLLAAAAAVAVLSTALPWTLEFEALKRIPARTYGIFVTLEPAIATAAGAILLGQAIGLQSVLAIACVMGAALGVTLSDRQNLGV